MNREQRIISALVSNRSAFDSVSAIIAEDDFTDEGWIVVARVVDYYKTDEQATHVDKGWLIDSIAHDYPKHRDVFEETVVSLGEVSIPNIITEFRTLKKEAAGTSLAQCLLNKDGNAIEKYLEKYNHYFELERTEEDAEIFRGEDIESLLESVQPDNLIKIHPLSLNDRLGGGVVPGTQIAIYAPTEVGKSLLAVNMACGLLHDGRAVLYCGNEDPARMMLLRVYSRLTGMTREELLKEPARAREIAAENGYGNLTFYDMAPGSVFDVKRAIERYEPEVVFVDQMANMETSANFTKVEKNEYLAIKFRELAKRYSLVTVIVHQASDSAYGNLIVEKNDMYFSNVGVQGQMDVMIGIGMDQAFEQQDKRMLCLTKNKIGANHDSYPVYVKPELSKVIDI